MATPNFSRAASSSASFSRQNACALRDKRARAFARRCDRAGAARSRDAPRPSGGARGDEIGLRAQDDAVVDDFEPVGGKRRAGGGDVDDQLGGAGRRRAFGRAGAFDDAIIDDAVLGKEAAREVDVFGGDPHLAVVLEAERGGDVVEIGHGAHVDPGLRHGDDDIGEAEAELVDEAPLRDRRRAIISRTRSSPVMPRCTAPSASCVVISAAER